VSTITNLYLSGSCTEAFQGLETLQMVKMDRVAACCQHHRKQGGNMCCITRHVHKQHCMLVQLHTLAQVLKNSAQVLLSRRSTALKYSSAAKACALVLLSRRSTALKYYSAAKACAQVLLSSTMTSPSDGVAALSNLAHTGG
jgi:hypothetical protein